MNALLPLCLGIAALTAAPSIDPAPAPVQDKDIVEVAASAGSFKTLLAAAGAADLVDALKGDGPLTILAPTDDAFAKLGNDTIQNLLKPENKETLQRILLYHVVSGSVSSTDALKAGSAPTLAGPAVSFALSGGRLQVNGSVNVVGNDVQASNGVIHIIDEVLLPPAEKPDGRLVIGFFSNMPGEELAAYLGVDRHKCLLVSSVTKGGEAEKAGLRSYDLIIAIDGGPATTESVREAKSRAGFGGNVELSVLRRGTKVTVHTTVGIEDK